MSLTTLFPTSIWVEDYTEAELAHIQDDIAKNIVNIQGQSLSAPWGDSVSTTWNPNRNTDIEQFLIEGLALALIKSGQGYLKDIGYTGPGLRSQHSWFTWHKKGGWAYEHNLPQSKVCGLYVYQGTGSEGSLRITNPHPSQTLGHWPHDADQPPYHYVKLTQGRMILWPAYLNVRIEPNCSDHELIYASFTLI